jgi:phosphate starvation-inducible PhoH-like protein
MSKQKGVRSLKLKLEDLPEIEAITETQKKVFTSFEKGDNIVLAGSAGTGKTFVALYLALEEVLDRETPYDQVVLVRSIVPTRDIGYLPGNEDEKKDAYTGPYRSICDELFSEGDAWNKLVQSGVIKFESTSFIRGTTFNNSVVIVDEMQNLNFHELDSVITRIGRECRVILSGDYYQSDFDKEKDRDGILKFLTIVEQMKDFEIFEFGWEDIVRSGIVRDYIMTKEMLKVK